MSDSNNNTSSSWEDLENFDKRMDAQSGPMSDSDIIEGFRLWDQLDRSTIPTEIKFPGRD